MNAATATRPPVIDFHAHILVPEVYRETARHSLFTLPPEGPGITDELRRKGAARAELVCGQMAEVTDRLAKMDAMGVDVQVLTASLVHQRTDWADADTSLRLERQVNDRMAAIVRAEPKRFVGFGGVPLHVPALAVAELERLMSLGLKGVGISTMAGDMEIGDAKLHPFWAKAEELNAIVYIHPAGNLDPRFRRNFLWNSIGQNFEEAMAIASLIYEGVLEKYPALKIVISHGGGYMPFNAGRIDRNYLEKPSTRTHMSKPPADYMRMIYYDTCVYDDLLLQRLVEKVGADRVVMGSDYPVGDPKPVAFVQDCKALSDDEKSKIMSGNARALLGLM
jgi:aminocarboxymuconate-semialdehyde decarboxylase